MKNIPNWFKAGIPLLIALLVFLPSIANFAIEKLYLGELPEYQEVDEVVWLEQNWQPDDWHWWYHKSQGGGLLVPVPYSWFTALEQPKLSWANVFKPAPAFLEPEYLGRMGLLPDGKRDDNPDALPVGFTKTVGYNVAPPDGETIDAIGMTCATCHTGQINYKGKGIRIEGGPAMLDLPQFQKAFSVALGETVLPWRFNRFADRVLGEDSTRQQRAALKQDLWKIIREGLEVSKIEGRKDVYPKGFAKEGFGRLDALARIGNFVFGTELNDDNYVQATGAVNYPHIWSVPWFNWAQYNGSVKQPMARNAGEALGVFALVNLDESSPDAFESTVDIQGLFELENLLGGDSIASGLAAPKWPEDILGEIDREKAVRGKILYEQNCAQCHLPVLGSEELLDDRYWETIDNTDRKYLKMTMLNIGDIGTDPNTAENWAKRTVAVGNLIDNTLSGDNYEQIVKNLPDPEQDKFTYQGIVSAGATLQYIGEKAVEKGYDKLGLTPEQREEYNGFRPDLPRAPLAYKARPLNGIWATPPFLHNGSVPNLYEMLVPAAERTSEFYLGSLEFDPVYVGYNTEKAKGYSKIDTTIPGNFNTGHEFKGNGTGLGVIGPELSEDDRWALVEYLKTL